MLPFEKWHGLGNDFVVGFEADGWSLADGQKAVELCDRHRGVGADGLLIVGVSPARMTVFNADGSQSEMCGNGLRCVSAAIATRVATSDWFDVETGAGPHATRLLTSGEVELLMPRPRLMPNASGSALVRPRAGFDAAGYRLSTGNPHWVFVDLENPPDIALVGPGVRPAVPGAGEHRVRPAAPRRRPPCGCLGAWMRTDAGLWHRRGGGGRALALARAGLRRRDPHGGTARWSAPLRLAW